MFNCRTLNVNFSLSSITKKSVASNPVSYSYCSFKRSEPPSCVTEYHSVVFVP